MDVYPVSELLKSINSLSVSIDASPFLNQLQHQRKLFYNLSQHLDRLPFELKMKLGYYKSQSFRSSAILQIRQYYNSYDVSWSPHRDSICYATYDIVPIIETLISLQVPYLIQ